MTVEELHMENEYQLRLKDMSYSEKIRELTASFNQQIQSLKTTLQVCSFPVGTLNTANAQDLHDLL